jgi:tetratricopeptide (TPR) repeat protein
MHAGDDAMHQHHAEEADMILALGRLGNAYGMLQKYDDAEAAFHKQLTIIEKTFGPGYPRVTEPLRFLGSIAAARGKYAEAEGYFSRGLQINVNAFGENSTRTADSLKAMAGVYMVQAVG